MQIFQFLRTELSPTWRSHLPGDSLGLTVMVSPWDLLRREAITKQSPYLPTRTKWQSTQGQAQIHAIKSTCSTQFEAPQHNLPSEPLPATFRLGRRTVPGSHSDPTATACTTFTRSPP